MIWHVHAISLLVFSNSLQEMRHVREWQCAFDSLAKGMCTTHERQPPVSLYTLLTMRAQSTSFATLPSYDFMSYVLGTWHQSILIFCRGELESSHIDSTL